MPSAAFTYQPTSRSYRMTGLAVSLLRRSLRLSFAAQVRPTLIDPQVEKRRRVIRLADLPTLRWIPDKLTPVPLGPADWLEGPLSAHCCLRA